MKLGKIFGLFSRKKKKDDIEEEDFVDIGEYESGLEEEEVKMYVKPAEPTSLHDIPELKKEIYSGNILFIDISLVKQDKVLAEKMIKDLKLAAEDIGGDIAGIGANQVVVTPAGIKIERKKIGK